MGPPTYMRSVVDRNVDVRRVTTFGKSEGVTSCMFLTGLRHEHRNDAFPYCIIFSESSLQQIYVPVAACMKRKFARIGYVFSGIDFRLALL